MKEVGPRQINPANCESYRFFKPPSYMSGRIFFTFPDSVRSKIIRNAENKCEYCGTPNTGAHECHHIFPESLGGLQKAVNGVLLCGRCHKVFDREWKVNACVYSRSTGDFTPIKRGLQLCKDRDTFNSKKNTLISFYRRPASKKKRQSSRI